MSHPPTSEQPTVPDTSALKPALPPSDAPGQPASRPEKLLDVQDSPVEDLFRFLRRQPTKHYISFLVGAFALLSFVAVASWFIASSKTELSSALRMGELNSQIAGLKAESSAAGQIAAHLRDELRAKSADYQSAQQIIQSLQAALGEKDRKLVAAQGCESIRADFRRAVERAVVLARRVSSLTEGPAKKEMEAELRALDGVVGLLKGSMDACASR